MSFDNKVMGPSDETRRKRLRYQAWHRGTREMDLILGPFADSHLSSLSPAELDELERLFEVVDTTLFRWVSGQEPPPDQENTALFQRIKSWASAAKT